MVSTETIAKEAGLDPERIPVHVAIIMDGNGRWALRQGKDRLFGHWQGYRTLKNIVNDAEALGVRYLTVYGFSTENWRRSEHEVDGLMDLISQAVQAELEEMIETQIRIRVSGRIEGLPESLQRVLFNAIERTKDFTGFTIVLAINYGGRAEVVDAVRELARQVQTGLLHPEDIDEAMISARLYSPDIPDPDLMIRTAGELRLSNFLLWESAYSEIYVTPACWPEFGRDHLIAALAEYAHRTRKFGAVVE